MMADVVFVIQAAFVLGWFGFLTGLLAYVAYLAFTET